MKYLVLIIAILSTSTAASSEADGTLTTCAPSSGIALQVLGSGGPIADDGRASAGYLLWINGRARLMVDAGGGPYPALDDYLDRMLAPGKGAYAYLAGYLDGSAELVKLESRVVDPKLLKASRVYSDPGNDLEVFAIGVPHGPVPALAYRIRIGQKSIVFSGDQNGSSANFLEFARATDVLVMHLPVPEEISGVGRKLHAPPSVIGDIAASTGTGKLVLSHFMARSLENIQQSLEIIRSRYAGPLVSANDLQCINF